MPQVPIQVQINFSGVTYSNGAWSGTPTWTVPGKVKVNPGTSTIVWRLNGLNEPSNFTAAFPATDAIDFSNSNPAWVGTTPTLQGDGTYQCTDTFSSNDTKADYEYSVTVSLAPDAGTNGTTGTWTLDPEIENDSGR